MAKGLWQRRRRRREVHPWREQKNYFGEMVHHLKRTGGQYGLQMMCGGGGIGIATVVEKV